MEYLLTVLQAEGLPTSMTKYQPVRLLFPPKLPAAWLLISLQSGMLSV